jgi:hypothetical protein
MAKVSAVKDGSSPQHLVDPFGREIAITALECRLQGRELRCLSTLPPEFSRARPSREAQYVVVEFAMDEPPGRLCTRTGDDRLPPLSPAEAEALLCPPASHGVPCPPPGVPGRCTASPRRSGARCAG